MLQLLVTLESFITGRMSHGDRGATAVEYGLMVALIAAAIFVTVSAVGTDLIDLFGRISTTLDAA